MTRQEMRDRARAALGRNLFGKKWLMALLAAVVCAAVIYTASYICGIGILIVIGPMLIGFSAILLSMSRMQETADIGQMFKEGFSKDFGRTLVIGLMKWLFTALWTMLFVVPGIVKSYSYAMTEYIAVDHPEYDWKQCIDESRRMMDGHKWDLFILDMSFIGWIILSILTGGIGFLWLAPYMTAARTEFYRDLIGDTAVGCIAGEPAMA